MDRWCDACRAVTAHDACTTEGHEDGCHRCLICGVHEDRRVLPGDPLGDRLAQEAP